MTPEADKPAKPARSRRIYIYWGVALALLLTAGLLSWLVVVPVWQTHRVLDEEHFYRDGEVQSGEIVERLGGEDQALRKLHLYMRMPQWLCPYRSRAACIFEACGDRGISALIEYTRDGNSSVQFVCLKTLILMDDPTACRRAAGNAVECLADDDERVRNMAVNLLRYAGDSTRPFFPRMRELLKHPDPEIRKTVLRALKEIADKTRETDGPAVATSEDTDESARKATLDALTREMGGAVIEAFADADASVRKAAYEALDTFEPLSKKQMPALVEAARNPELEPRGRGEALRALARIGPAAADALDAIRDSLADENPRVRAFAIYALGKVSPGSAEALAAAVAGLKDADERTRRIAAFTLGESGDSRALKPLDAALKDKDADVRQAAAAALKKIRSPAPPGSGIEESPPRR